MSTATAETGTFVLFELAATTYAIRSSEVRQLEMIEQITPVPNAGEAVEGVVFSRGQVIPAISLRVRFGFEKAPYDISSRLIVVSVGDRNIGLIVDSAREFKNIPDEAFNPPPEGLASVSGTYIEAIATIDGRPILLLDLAEVARIAEGIETEV